MIKSNMRDNDRRSDRKKGEDTFSMSPCTCCYFPSFLMIPKNYHLKKIDKHYETNCSQVKLGNDHTKSKSTTI
ncbi:hypothetical protein POVWA2_019580 [Plasmodium ovale wallikeri]|uniref:Uncharacterized protein n=1 Tax=Plasmodium ovale wallikeri TaxID=864142 RepID=A0A1A8YQG5_PLAOA|nr:hypothetical protein POVWA1_019310 [Plasmodium ovale wallikeri]SBT34392.1 hypothetical protein POVWA2_019580 [Plasmodium ovale wallikeri]